MDDLLTQFFNRDGSDALPPTRALRSIGPQVAKAERAVAGETSVKRNRFVALSGATKKVNRALEANARALAGIKGYWTDLDSKKADAQFVIASYRQLFTIEKSFRMSKHDLQARPIYHRKIESIEADLNIVFAALAVSRWIENATGWSIKTTVRTARRQSEAVLQPANHGQACGARPHGPRYDSRHARALEGFAGPH